MTPASQSKAYLVRFARPQLSANAAVGERLRWSINKMDWREGHELYRSSNSSYFYQSSSFESSQTIRLLHEDVVYDAARSLYYYTYGMFLQPKNWSYEGRIEFRFGSSYYDDQALTKLPGIQDTLASREGYDADGHDLLLSSTFRYGISKRLQLLTGLTVGRGGYTRDEFDNLLHREAPDSFVERKLTNSNQIDREYAVFVEPLFFQSDNHWSSFRASYESNRTTEYDQVQDFAVNHGTAKYEEQGLWEDKSYGLSLSHNWTSRNSKITRQQILDDWTGYYGHRLERGTIRIGSEMELQFDRTNSRGANTKSAAQTMATGFDNRRDNLMTAWSEATYFTRFDIDVSVRFDLQRESTGSDVYRSNVLYSHSQQHYFTLGLIYNSYRWTPEKRQSINWDNISDIDYLYGPLLRPGDWQATMKVVAPTHRWSARQTSESLFNFFKGESDNSWHWSWTGAAGVCEGLVVGVDATYGQYVIASELENGVSYYSRSDSWRVTPHLRWQPGQGFRIDFSLYETYYDYDWSIHSNQRDIVVHEYDHSWRIRAIYNIVI